MGVDKEELSGGYQKQSRAIFSKVRLQVDQLSKQNYFPIVPQLQYMIYHFLALLLLSNVKYPISNVAT